MDRDAIAALYFDGVGAIVTIAATLDGGTWLRPACGTWNASETARHVLSVARWYDQWLDRALADIASPPFPASAIDGQNRNGIAALHDLDGPQAVSLFETTALAYLDRARTHWDVPYSYPYGTVTAGLHLGVAATEWHLHAFDLASACDRTYAPRDATALFRAAGVCVAETKTGFRRTLLRQLVPVGARIQPWRTMLRQSGRALTTSEPIVG